MHLRPDIHLAKLGPDVVLLDERRGDYFCLADAAAAFASSSVGEVSILDPDLAEEARTLGLTRAGGARTPWSAPPPIADLMAHPDKPLTRQDRRDGALAFLTALGRYHGWPFARLLAYARRHKRASLEAGLATIADQVTAFRQLLPWAPFQGVCLYRSFLLLAFLRRQGLDATWVFGVQAWPLEAHCWLQAGDVVLDDSLDHVLPFTPILAI